MKILVLGGGGMAGHMLVDYFRKVTPYSVFFTTRDPVQKDGLYLDVRDHVMVEKLVESVVPDVVINTVGILNQQAEINALEAYQVNAIFPNVLRDIVDKVKGKLIHISTDCVFLGDRGNYTEHDMPDGESVYAKTKALGEIIKDRHLTIRTSIVGPEIRSHGIGLYHWFMQQRGQIKGYTNVYWNGVTTLELAKAIDYLIRNPLSGLLHLHAPEKVSKYELLKLFQEQFGHRLVNIVPDGEIKQDRSLVSTRNDFHYRVPVYTQMLSELYNWMWRE